MSSIPSQAYQGFLSHEWGEIAPYLNHNRVKKIYQALQSLGVTTWIDEENLEEGTDMRPTLSNAVKASDCFVVFLTSRYQEKVNSGNPLDYCRFEYFVAIREKKRMISVVLEKEMKNPKEWTDSIFVDLHDKLYVDLSDETQFTSDEVTEEFKNYCEPLARAISRTNIPTNCTPRDSDESLKICSVHQALNHYYCSKCKAFICEQCKANLHREHNSIPVIDEVNNIKDAFRANFTQLDAYIQRLGSTSQRIDSTLMELLANKETTELNINKSFDELIQIVNDERERQLSAMDQIYAEKQSLLDEQKLVVDTFAVDLKEKVERYQAIPEFERHRFIVAANDLTDAMLKKQSSEAPFNVTMEPTGNSSLIAHVELDRKKIIKDNIQKYSFPLPLHSSRKEGLLTTLMEMLHLDYDDGEHNAITFQESSIKSAIRSFDLDSELFYEQFLFDKLSDFVEALRSFCPIDFPFHSLAFSLQNANSPKQPLYQLRDGGIVITYPSYSFSFHGCASSLLAFISSSHALDFKNATIAGHHFSADSPLTVSSSNEIIFKVWSEQDDLQSDSGEYVMEQTCSSYTLTPLNLRGNWWFINDLWTTTEAWILSNRETSQKLLLDEGRFFTHEDKLFQVTKDGFVRSSLANYQPMLVTEQITDSNLVKFSYFLGSSCFYYLSKAKMENSEEVEYHHRVLFCKEDGNIVPVIFYKSYEDLNIDILVYAEDKVCVSSSTNKTTQFLQITSENGRSVASLLKGFSRISGPLRLQPSQNIEISLGSDMVIINKDSLEIERHCDGGIVVQSPKCKEIFYELKDQPRGPSIFKICYQNYLLFEQVIERGNTFPPRYNQDFIVLPTSSSLLVLKMV